MKTFMKNKHGFLLGFIPYDFRRPTWARLKRRMWNGEEERIVVPRDYGIGWTVNLYRLRERYPWLFYMLLAVVAGIATRELWRYFKAEDGED